MWSTLLSGVGLKIGIGAALLLGAYSWHAAALRNAKQLQEAETRSQVVTEQEAQRAIDTKKYEERITELEQRVVDLAKTRAATVQRIEVIQRQAETQRAEIPNLNDDAVLAAIRQYLSGANTAAAIR